MRKFAFVFLILLLLPCCNNEETEAPQPQEPVKEEPAPAEREFHYTFETGGKKFGAYLSNRYGANDVWLAYTTDGKTYTEVFTGCALFHDGWRDDYTAAFANGKIVITYDRPIREGTDVGQSRFAATLEEIERDTDKDGLPDLVEYRFMTDATNPDTDGDGKKDGADMNPLASGKIKLNRHQEIWKTAFLQYESKYQDFLQLPAERFAVASFKSSLDFFELPGRENPVLAMTEDGVIKLAEQTGYYIPRVIFREVAYHSGDLGEGRAVFEMELIFEPLLGRAYRLTLEEREGKWKLIDIRVERVY